MRAFQNKSKARRRLLVQAAGFLRGGSGVFVGPE